MYMPFGPKVIHAAGFAPDVRNITAATTLAFNEDAGRPLVVTVAGGAAITLPESVGSGFSFDIIIGTTLTGDVTVTTNGTDAYRGGVIINDTGDSTAVTADFYPGAGGTIFTFDQSAGVIAGDWLRVTDIADGVWRCEGALGGQADAATPFS